MMTATILLRRLSSRHIAQRLKRCVAQEASDRHVYASVLGTETVTQDLLSREKARDIVVMDMRKKCNYTDYFILATGSSQRHLERLASAVLFQLKEEMRRSQVVQLARDLPPEIQGEGGSEWVVVDAGNILVHLMTEKKRIFLDLQSLWDEEGASVTIDTAVQPVLTKDSITVEDSRS